MKYFLVHGGFSTTDGNSRKVFPLGLYTIVHAGWMSFHSHEVPMLNSVLTLFLMVASDSSAPPVHGPEVSCIELLPSIEMESKTSTLADRLPVSVSHGA